MLVGEPPVRHRVAQPLGHFDFAIGDCARCHIDTDGRLVVAGECDGERIGAKQRPLAPQRGDNGGGVGGATAARYIRRADPSIEVTLIDNMRGTGRIRVTTDYGPVFCSGFVFGPSLVATSWACVPAPGTTRSDRPSRTSPSAPIRIASTARAAPSAISRARSSP